MGFRRSAVESPRSARVRNFSMRLVRAGWRVIRLNLPRSWRHPSIWYGTRTRTEREKQPERGTENETSRSPCLRLPRPDLNALHDCNGDDSDGQRADRYSVQRILGLPALVEGLALFLRFRPGSHDGRHVLGGVCRHWVADGPHAVCVSAEAVRRNLDRDVAERGKGQYQPTAAQLRWRGGGGQL